MRRVVSLPFPATPILSSPEDLGRHIRAARTQSGMTLETAALSIGVAKQTMVHIETNPGSVSLSLVLQAAQALGVTLFAVPAQKQILAERVLLSELS